MPRSAAFVFYFGEKFRLKPRLTKKQTIIVRLMLILEAYLFRFLMKFCYAIPCGALDNRDRFDRGGGVSVPNATIS